MYIYGLPSSGTNKEIKQEPEAELILHKAKEVHVKSEPEADFYLNSSLQKNFFTDF